MAKLYRRLPGFSNRRLAPVRGALVIALACFALASIVHAQQPTVPPRPAQPAATTPATADSPNEDGTAESGAELDATLARLRVDNPRVRRTAVDQILALGSGDLPALRARISAPLPIPSLNVHAAMVRAVRTATGGREGADYDLLDALMQTTPRTQDVVVATERIALARAVGRILTADAGRIMVAFALDHDKVFRMEATRIIRNSLRDCVLPALIEMRRPTDDARGFIRTTREALRRVTPGESVQTRDNALLAEILRAYGSIRQPDAMNVVLSFVNSDRAQVREAARWGVSQYGRDAINALRQAYENYVGEDANATWGWERTARELYEANDRRRSDEVAHALDDGLAASRAGRFPEMLERFEFVLSHHPLFERRTEMVAPLMNYGHSLEHENAARAEEIYRLALRIDPAGPLSHSLQSSVLYLQAERALAVGVADPELYRVALRADPANQRAQAQLDSVAQVEVLRARQRRRMIIALGLLAVAMAALGLLVARARRATDEPPSGDTPGNQRMRSNTPTAKAPS